MRRALWTLALLGNLAGACSSQESNTRIVVVVWSDLTIPTEIDSIHIDVTGPTSARTGSFPLTTGNETGKSKLPVVLALVQASNQDLSFTVTARGFLGNNPNPVVSQAARLDFLSDQSRVLTLFLGRACLGVTCGGNNTCSNGTCAQSIDVNVSSLPAYDPQAPLSSPDAAPGPRLDSGSDGVAAEGGIPDARGVDAMADEGQTVDSAADKPAHLPIPGLDGGVDAGTGGTSGSGGSGGTTAATGGTGGSGVGGAGDSGLPDAPDAPPDVPVGGAGGTTGLDGTTGTGGTATGGTTDASDGTATGGTSAGGAAGPTGGAAGTGGSCSGTMCGSTCSDLTMDVNNCGQCGRPCQSANVLGLSCNAGLCNTAACSGVWGNCTQPAAPLTDDGCETYLNTRANCGGCGIKCTSTQACVLGTCQTVPYALPTAAMDVYLGAGSLVLDGTKAYITKVADTSLKVLDVSNPLSPTVLGSVNHGYSDSQLAAHAIYNNIVWIVRSSCCGYGYATSMFGVDVSNPASPYVRGSLQLQTASSLVSWWSNLLVYSGYLLVQDYAQNKVYVIDISNPDAPKKFSEWSLPWMVDGGDAGMTIDGHYLYMPCRQAQVLNIYDLTNLAAVTLAGSVSTGSEEAWEWPAKIGSYLYLNVSTYGSGVVHMKVVDVSNPAAPTIVGTVASTGETIAKNGRLFSLGTSGSNATASAYSLANPIAPVVEASSTVPPPSPSTSLNLWLMASPQAGWVGDFLIGMTDGSSGYSGVRAVYFPVN